MSICLKCGHNDQNHKFSCPFTLDLRLQQIALEHWKRGWDDATLPGGQQKFGQTEAYGLGFLMGTVSKEAVQARYL